MGRITKIIDRARLILSDKDATRWSDEDLVTLLNEGINNFVLHTKSLKRRSYLLIENNIGIYNISPYASSIQRVQYLSTVLDVKLSSQMDKLDPTWEDTTGDVPTTVVFDTYSQCVFRLYPKVSEGSANIITQNSLFGGLIDVQVTDDLFTVPDVENLEQDLSKYLLVFYTAVPRTLTVASLDDEIDIPLVYDAAMIAYITSQCLLFDQDSISRELGNNQLNMYNTYLTQAIMKESSSNNSATNYEILYRSF